MHLKIWNIAFGYCFILLACAPSNALEKENFSSQLCEAFKNEKVWIATITEKGEDVIVKSKNVKFDTEMEVDSLVSILNDKFPDVGLRIVNVRSKTIFVKLENSEYLTQTMGSTGSLQYKSMVVFNFTELSKIESVMFDYEEGDHGGQPGTLDRKDFKSFVVIECGQEKNRGKN